MMQMLSTRWPLRVLMLKPKRVIINIPSRSYAFAHPGCCCPLITASGALSARVAMIA
jgi:hypothetical protein